MAASLPGEIRCVKPSVKSKTNADHFVNQGMIRGIVQMGGRLKTWLRHQKDVHTCYV